MTLRLLLTLILCSPIALADPVAKLRIITTSDLHGHMLDYDYYKDRPNPKQGLARAATVIRIARAEADNSVLVDNGDLLQGSPMADWASKQVFGNQFGPHPAFSAMDMLGYNAGNLGNHDFNYGLDFLKYNIGFSNFPVVNANVYHVNADGSRGDHVFTPWFIEETQINDILGQPRDIKIGYIGFTPPQIMEWDKNNLEGRVIARDIIETAQEELPKLKAAGADIIIAIPHSGLSTDSETPGMENVVYYLARNRLIDAIAFGHEHAIFPSEEFDGIQGVNIARGTIFGTPAVMPNKFGTHIGVMDLTLQERQGKWYVVNAKAEARSIIRETGAPVTPYMMMERQLLPAHRATRRYVNQPIGATQTEFNSYFALLTDSASVEIVNLAQLDYADRWRATLPEYSDLPLVSAAAPFKAGGKGDEPTDYTEVSAGVMSLRNAADLYLYANELVVLKVTKEELDDWLECTAGQFLQLDTTLVDPQPMINWDFRTYNFDIFQGVDYDIDLDQPARFDNQCHLIDAAANRVRINSINGLALSQVDDVLVVTNNFRAYGGGNFAGATPDNVVYHAPDTNRQILINYIAGQQPNPVNIIPDFNWRFAPVPAFHQLEVSFISSPSRNAKIDAENIEQYPLRFNAVLDSGFAEFIGEFPRYTPIPEVEINPGFELNIKGPKTTTIEIDVTPSGPDTDDIIDTNLNDVKAIVPSHYDADDNEEEDENHDDA